MNGPNHNSWGSPYLPLETLEWSLYCRAAFSIPIFQGVTRMACSDLIPPFRHCLNPRYQTPSHSSPRIFPKAREPYSQTYQASSFTISISMHSLFVLIKCSDKSDFREKFAWLPVPGYGPAWQGDSSGQKACVCHTVRCGCKCISEASSFCRLSAPYVTLYPGTMN